MSAKKNGLYCIVLEGWSDCGFKKCQKLVSVRVVVSTKWGRRNIVLPYLLGTK